MRPARSKLHPSTCFPPSPPPPDTRNRLLVHVGQRPHRFACPRLTFIGANATTYSTIAGLLACRLSTSIESIKVFDIGGQSEARAALQDLLVIGLFNRTDTRLQWAQSYWETRGSTIIVVNVQHNRLGVQVNMEPSKGLLLLVS